VHEIARFRIWGGDSRWRQPALAGVSDQNSRWPGWWLWQLAPALAGMFYPCACHVHEIARFRKLGKEPALAPASGGSLRWLAPALAGVSDQNSRWPGWWLWQLAPALAGMFYPCVQVISEFGQAARASGGSLRCLRLSCDFARPMCGGYGSAGAAAAGMFYPCACHVHEIARFRNLGKEPALAAAAQAAAATRAGACHAISAVSVQQTHLMMRVTKTRAGYDGAAAAGMFCPCACHVHEIARFRNLGRWPALASASGCYNTPNVSDQNECLCLSCARNCAISEFGQVAPASGGSASCRRDSRWRQPALAGMFCPCVQAISEFWASSPSQRRQLALPPRLALAPAACACHAISDLGK